MKPTLITDLKFETLHAGTVGIESTVNDWLSEQKAKENKIAIIDISYFISTIPGSETIYCFILYREV